jgi:ABC-type uncharacterized transport system permease subunit
MIETSAFWLRVAACLYAVGLLHALLTAVRQGESVFGIAMAAFRVGVVIHAVAIADLAMAIGHIPIDNYYQTLSFCALLSAIVFVALERRYRLASVSIGLFPLIFAMTLAGALEQPVASPASEGMRNIWLIIHILLVLIGYAALLFTALTAGAYLVQERRLKTKQSSALLERLPPLGTLDRMLSQSLGLGFVFLTLGLIIAILWAFLNAETSWISDPRITISIFTWLLLLLMMFMRASAGWRGRKVAVMSLVVLGSSALTWVTHAGLGATLTP